MRSVKFTASNGSTVTLDSSGSQYFITSIEGIDIPGVDSQTQKAPYQDGVTNIDQLLQPRDITIEGFIKTPVDLTLINTYRRALEAILNPKLGVGNIVYTYNSGSKQIAAKCVACTFANRNMPEPFQRFQIQFECPDPYMLSTTTDATSVGLVSSLTKFPIKFDTTYPIFSNIGIYPINILRGTSDPSGNIWGVSYGNGIYKCLAGSTIFSSVGAGALNWLGICSDPSGNIWATVQGGDIYKCNSGSTTFNALGAGTFLWRNITSDPSGNIWVSNGSNGNIYKCNSGSTTFTALGVSGVYFSFIVSDPSGNIWATSHDIYKCNSGSTTFTALGVAGGGTNWGGITSDPSGNIWANIYSDTGDIYRCNSGSTTFLALGVADGYRLHEITSEPSGNIWTVNESGNIYKCLTSETTFINVRGNYPECSNIINDPSGNIWCFGTSVAYKCDYDHSTIIGLTIFSETSPSPSRIITNNGDVPEPILATLYGPAINPTLINETTGEFIHLIYTLNQGESLQINTAFGMKTITLNSGGNTTNGLQYLDPQSTFFQLIVGDNLMNLHDDTGSAQLRCDVGKIDRYVGI